MASHRRPVDTGLLQSGPGLKQSFAFDMTIIRFDSAFDDLLPRDARRRTGSQRIHVYGRPAVAADRAPCGSAMSSATWSGSGRADGPSSSFCRPGGYDGNSLPAGGFIGPNGMTAGPNGDVLLCQHGNRRIVRIDPDMRVSCSSIISTAGSSTLRTISSTDRMARCFSPTRHTDCRRGRRSVEGADVQRSVQARRWQARRHRHRPDTSERHRVFAR